MGKKGLSFPETPKGWAKLLTDVLHSFNSGSFSPVNVKKLAPEYSKQVFSDSPITLVEGDNLSNRFEGALIPNSNEWGILYNTSVSEKRQNFTVAHEFGHYLLHRKKHSNGIRCKEKDMLYWRSEEAKIEAEANTFASCLLMPANDFSRQIINADISKDIIYKLSDRYHVSITAVALRWISLSYNDNIMLVSSKDGFIDWSWSSKNLMKKNVYFSARKTVIPLPINSLAKLNSEEDEVEHDLGVWSDDYKVKEILLYNNGEFSLSLLLYYIQGHGYSYEEEKIDELSVVANL